MAKTTNLVPAQVLDLHPGDQVKDDKNAFVVRQLETRRCGIHINNSMCYNAPEHWVQVVR